MVLQFFTSDRLLKELNHSFIVLLPKRENSTVHDFRPISLSIVAYKVIDKVLVSQLRPILPKLISSNQVAFVSGRSIQENSVLGRKNSFTS